MSNEKKKAFEMIEMLTKEAVEVVNIYLSWVLEKEENRADTPEERRKELREIAKRKKEAERIERMKEKEIIKEYEEKFETLRNKTLPDFCTPEETILFLFEKAQSLKIYLKFFPEKIYEVIEVIHAHGYKAGENKKATNPTTKQGKRLFLMPTK